MDSYYQLKEVLFPSNIPTVIGPTENVELFKKAMSLISLLKVHTT